MEGKEGVLISKFAPGANLLSKFHYMKHHSIIELEDIITYPTRSQKT